MKKPIVEYLNTDYKSYAIYVVKNRAIPNIIDGFKPVHRKIFYTAMKHCKNSSMKTASLVGFALAESNYHHGDAPMEGAINALTQAFIGSNNIPMCVGEGSFGNRMIQVAAAGRYTRVKLNPEFLKYFNDFEILDNSEDPENPEPLCYLPIIPWVLVNGTEGIAVGFSTYILPRDPEKLKQYISAKILGQPTDYDFEPYFKGFKGLTYKLPDSNSWVMEGCFERLSNNVIKITELPIGFDREKYTEFLEKLLSKKKIKDYDENCSSEFEFMVKIDKNLDDEEIVNLLRIDTTLTENIVVIDNEGKLREYETPEKLVDYFIEYRLKKYGERLKRNHQLSVYEISLIDEKIRFIQMVTEGKIKINRITKAQLIKILEEENFVFANELIGTQIYKFTKDEIEKLLERRKDLENYIQELLSTTAKDEWLKELK